MSGYEWTGDDAAFAGRVDAALTGSTSPPADLDEWRECCRRWGPRSMSALGCLLGFVEAAWPGYSDLSVVFVEGGVVMEILPGDSFDWQAWEKWDADSLAEVLLAALEAATR